MGNSNLNNARRDKNDEFYTQYEDVEKELEAYLAYNPELFRDKVILLPCDNPAWSNFTKYFVHNFNRLGLKKLISTYYTPQQTLFAHTAHNEGNEETESRHGKILIVEKIEGKENPQERWESLAGDGDFRSEEITNLRDEADFVITNPPFSLFREFISWLFAGKCQFAVIGNMNAATCKEIFPLIKENKLWPGQEFNKTMNFAVPNEYTAHRSLEEKDSFGRNIVRVPAICWFTNIPHGKKYEPIPLSTKAENERFNKKVLNNPRAYKKYDNYDAIEVPSVSAIPSDYKGIMGVPISFLTKYCPEQFEILGTQRWAKSPELLNVYTGNCVPAEKDKKTTINGKETYDRIFIKHKGV